MKRLLAVLFILVLMPSLARALPPCPADQNETYHNFYGTYTDTDGTKYVGAWRNGKQHGQGTVFHADGRVHPEGIIENGKFKYAQKISPTHKEPTQNLSNSPLDNAKKECAELGFTKGTEKFGDCVMKLID